ncbi:MAG: AAA family ATPase [Phycisphaerae bacterium]|jgi:MoxR-like ATPase|nr:AAA family ATPase [Phycisphaerae bacterium]
MDDLAAVRRLHEAYGVIRSELAKVIVGQEDVIELLLIGLFARGHVILEGVPGLAKTLMISSLARCLGLKFNRIQFMPDLMPADITGTEVIQEDKRTGQRSFRFLPGPIFANVVLADEINRTPPKTQAALLEAMQERHVTVGGVQHDLEPPFFVLATQNPIEQEGTYPLPEAQQDRFMFKVFVDYPGYEQEYEIAERTTSAAAPELREVLARDEILAFQDVVRRVPAAPSEVHYTLELVRLTRPSHNGVSGAGLRSAESGAARGGVLPLIDRLVTFGAGPRAVQFLLLGAKARAVMHGRKYVGREDIDALAQPVLRHRIITNYAAEAEDYDPDRIIAHVLQAVQARQKNEGLDAGVAKVLRP